MLNKIGISIRNNILVGLVLVTPIAVTGFIVNLLFRFATNFLPRALKESNDAILFRFLALFAVLFALFIIGLLVRNFAGRKFYKFGDRLLTRIPIISRIYISVRQVSEALVAQRETLFKEVVLVEYPRKGLYSMGFITAIVPPHLTGLMSATDNPSLYVALFIPTTPNPTSGLFIMAPRTELVSLPITITDAMKLIISGGAVFPGQDAEGVGPNLLEKLEKVLLKEEDSSEQKPAVPT
ncbi:MAG TPA: hypothetical protein DCZ95_05930 [Verrucomicrobia bacterium]|nr:MAG: hypothetical protein A2X46_09790 [Lentisphaerae bacterium GWF2_57_35]HBA83617.1 hypothetical protein [Verrucomicrobiota bacterium]